MQTLTYLYNIGSIFLYKILFIRSFIYSEINTFGLPKCSKIIFAFNIFVPIHVLEMVYLKTKVYKKSPRWTFLCREPSITKRIWGNLVGGFSPLSPPGSAYDEWLVSMTVVRLCVGSALTISFGLACRGCTFDRNAFKSTFSKSVGFTFRVYV